jgi:hypothetical protein
MPFPTVNVTPGTGATINTLPNAGQATKAESLPFTLASDDDLLARIGEVQASPTANTLLDRVKSIVSGLNNIVLAAGANVIGKVGLQIAGSDVANANPVPTAAQASEAHIGEVGGHIAIASAAMTRPADTSAYSVGDLIANNTVAGSVVPIPLAVARVNNGSGMIRRLRLKTNDAAFAAAVIRVHLYRDSPSVTNGDNGVFLTTESNYIGYADITLNRHFSDAEKGFGVPAVGSEWSFQPSAGTQTIFALFEARTAVTPSSATVFTLVAETCQN